MLGADIAVVKDVKAVPDRVRASEEDLRGDLCNMQDSLRCVESSQLDLMAQVSAMEDRCRQYHIKIRGIPDDVPLDELPHLQSCLMVTLLPLHLARKLALDGIYCLPRSPTAPPNVAWDTIIRCASI
ncbi:Hypothetical predicted protein [Pelobates cultripes]|uniref:Uncharacterized protein n=1 Tax=Pelobates cultripes TaxID=61616 RepID=A0AAD1S1C2_PELCU|nr:Hypothetical predicted protein [Pelobates cultripes]